MHADQWLKFLIDYVAHHPRDGHIFRTIIDKRNAHRRGSPFLSKNGTPKWFNNPRPTDPRLPLMDFISVGSRAVIDGKSVQRLIVDHAVPFSFLHDRLVELPKNVESFEPFLIANYKLGVLTKDEDNALTKNNLRKSMPHLLERQKSLRPL